MPSCPQWISDRIGRPVDRPATSSPRPERVARMNPTFGAQSSVIDAVSPALTMRDGGLQGDSQAFALFAAALSCTRGARSVRVRRPAAARRDWLRWLSRRRSGVATGRAAAATDGCGHVQPARPRFRANGLTVASTGEPISLPGSVRSRMRRSARPSSTSAPPLQLGPLQLGPSQLGGTPVCGGEAGA